MVTHIHQRAEADKVTQRKRNKKLKTKERSAALKQQHAIDAVTRAQDLMALGRYSKAHKTLLSKGLGDLADSRIVSQIATKQPQRTTHLPGTLPLDIAEKGTQSVDLRQRYRKLKPLSGTGPSDYRNEYLRALAGEFTTPLANEVISEHEKLAARFINAKLPSWYYYVIGSVEMVALIKKEASTPADVPDVRPIGVSNCRRRAWLTELPHTHAPTCGRTLQLQQMAVGVKAGLQKLYTAINIHTSHPAHKTTS